ncbi:very short patch repair endonuclease [Methylorubrum populi]|nr:very short patch repair endonuclease [Methylorubrum populi]
MDTLDPERRSALMGRIRGVDTGPEMAVRRPAHRLGYRFRLHRRSLLGRPDLVFPSRRAAIFVHGCFWHRHEGCSKASTPKTRVEFWQAKFASNVERDAQVQQRLATAGWRVLVIWECETARAGEIDRILVGFLGPGGPARPPTDADPRRNDLPFSASRPRLCRSQGSTHDARGDCRDPR